MGGKNKGKILFLIGICFMCSQYFNTHTLFALPIEKERISGTDTYKTATAISQKGWERSDYAVLVRGDDYADGLSACPLAHMYLAPILMTQPTSIDIDTLMELDRLGVKHLIIIGGLEAISQQIEDTIRKEGITSIERIYGGNRYQTSAKIAEKFSSKEVAIVTGDNYIDALSISFIAAKRGIPILLTQKHSLPLEISTYISERTILKTYLVGGVEVISKKVEKQLPEPLRLAGSNRFETNAIILNIFASELDFNSLYVTTGNNEFAHALVGGVLAARTSSPLALVDSDNYLNAIKNLQDRLTTSTKIIGIGNEQTVPPNILEAIASSVVAEQLSESSMPSSPEVTNRVNNVSSTSLKGYYKEGDTIAITVTFDGNVEVTGTPSILLATGSNREANYSTGSGTSVLTFEYRVQSGDTSTNLDYVGVDSLRLNGGQIKTAGTNSDAQLILVTPGEPGSLSEAEIIIDTTIPKGLDISLQNLIPAEGMFTLGVEEGPLSDLSWHNILEEIKTNTGQGDNWITGILSTDLTMTVSDNGVTATIHNTSSQEAVITQDFEIPAGKIIDRAGNSTSEEILINSYVAVVTDVSSTIGDGYYKVGEIIEITISFSSDVEVIGIPHLLLETGEHNQEAIYAGGSGTSVLSLQYTVQLGDTSKDLDYLGIDALDTNGGSIKMTDRNEDVSLLLAFPGEIGSLSANKNIIIDTASPSAITPSSQNIIPKGQSIDLNVVGGPLTLSSWLSILSQIKTNTTNGEWIRGISKNDLGIDIHADGTSAKLNNNSPNDALIGSDFIITADRVFDRAGNVALSDIQIDSCSHD